MRLLAAAAIGLATFAQDAALKEVLAKAAQYASEYEQRFSLLVAEEHYVQELRRQTAAPGATLSTQNPGGGFARGPYESAPSGRKVLRADYLLVRLDGGGGWMPFRDVFEVDGRKVQDRNDRLVNLFLKPSPTSFDQASRIMQDSTRHNLGGIVRTINIPTLAILFLTSELQPRFEFTAAGDEEVAGRTTRRIGFREVQRPTLIRTRPPRRSTAQGPSPTTTDLPMRGHFWIDPATGTVLKSRLTAADGYTQSEITVTFKQEAALDLWVPVQMDEQYREAGDERDTFGTATYSNYRRFQVSTDEKIGKPPGR